MSITTLLRDRVNDLKQTYQIQLEERFEPVYEDTRKESFSKELEEDSSSIRKLNVIDKETERLKLNKQLKMGEQTIKKLWQKFLFNLAVFQIIFDCIIFSSLIIGTTLAFTKLVSVAFFFFIIALLLIFSSRLEGWYFVLACYLSGGRIILDQLFDEYREYGQNEAKLLLSDPRKLSCSSVQTTWLFTTLQRISPD